MRFVLLTLFVGERNLGVLTSKPVFFYKACEGVSNLLQHVTSLLERSKRTVTMYTKSSSGDKGTSETGNTNKHPPEEYVHKIGSRRSNGDLFVKPFRGWNRNSVQRVIF